MNPNNKYDNGIIYSWYSEDSPERCLVLCKNSWHTKKYFKESEYIEMIKDSIKEYKDYIVYNVLESYCGIRSIDTRIFIKKDEEHYWVRCNTCHIVYRNCFYAFENGAGTMVEIISDRRVATGFDIKFHADPLICLIRLLGVTRRKYRPELVDWPKDVFKGHIEPMIGANGFYDISIECYDC